MKIIYNIAFLAVILCLMTSCEKENLLDGKQAIERSSALEKELKTTLQNSKDGWIVFINTLNTKVKTSMPFIMKFDTLDSKVKMTSMYGKDVPSYFSISATTGMPLLTFSTGSGLSAIYEVGSTNVTDYFFKVLKVSSDTITIQSYRKGSGSASEGGAILKMVKNNNPSWIKDWQTETASLYSKQSFFGRFLTTRLTFASGETFAPVTSAFITFGAPDIAYLRANYPTSANNMQTVPMLFSYFPPSGQVDPLSFMGYNSLYFDIYAAASTNALYGVAPSTLQALYKTNYFFIRKINPTSVDIFAIDKDGKEVITGTISL